MPEFNIRTLLTPDVVDPYVRYRLLNIKEDEKDSDGNIKWVQVLHGPMKKAVAELVRHKATAGDFEKIPNSEGHSLRFLDAWNSVVDGVFDGYSEDEYLETIADEAMGMMGLPLLGFPKGALRDLKEDDAYEALMCALESGNFETSGSECMTDGERYQFKSEGWKVVGVKNVFGPKHSLEKFPMEPISPESQYGLEHLEVEFETGDLVINDMFRIKEFVEAWREVDSDGINADAGKNEATRNYLSELGMVCVCVGNSSPRICPDENGVIRFANPAYNLEEEAWDDKWQELDHFKSVCTDLWWVSVIDKKRLIDVIAKATGDTAEAVEKVEQFIKDTWTVTEMKVEPGTHHLYFGRSSDVLLNHYEFEGVDTKDLDTFFILSKDELIYTPKPGTPVAEVTPSAGMKM